MFNFFKFIMKGEVLFAGFLFSSVFKGLFNFPLDLTLMFMILTISTSLIKLFKAPYVSKKTLLPLAIYGSLFLVMLVSYTYSPSQIYAQDKMIKFATITAWSYFGVISLIKDKKALDNFIKGLLFYGSLTIIIVFYNFIKSGVSTIRVGVGEDGGNIIGLGRLSGITAIIIVIKGFYDKPKRIYKLGYFILLAVTIFVLMLTSARMALIALLVSVLMIFPISFKFNLKEIKVSKNMLSLLLLLPLLVVGFFITNVYKHFEVMIKRISVIFTQDGGGASVSSRSNMYDIAIDMWKESPFFGQGIGSYAIRYLGFDNRAYPHNIFMEFLSEIGLVGLILFVALFLIALKPLITVLKRGINSHQVIILMVLIFVLLNVNSSGDINDNRWIFSFLALTYMSPMYSDKEILESKIILRKSA